MNRHPAPETYWLPSLNSWGVRLKASEEAEQVPWDELVGLAGFRLDFLQVDRLDRLFRRAFPRPPADLQSRPVRLALLGSATTVHLTASIRVAGLRRGLWIEIMEGDYGQYAQALLGDDPVLDAFAPTAILLALDARHLTSGITSQTSLEEAEAFVHQRLDDVERCWKAAQARFAAIVLHQMPLPVLPPLLGLNEHRLAGSPARLLAQMSEELHRRADKAGVHLVTIDEAARQIGLSGWHDQVQWHRAKQEVNPAATPVYGDLVARLLAAAQGRSAKAMVLDLDNTLWGGVIGDDGLDGIVLGQGSALGEAFTAVQEYARALASRGVILAVCSKNDEAVALSVFQNHPEMLLKRGDITAFVANWDDKATNLRRIATMLNVGLDALVFLDDNPFERDLVRQELPQVTVPEIPDDEPAAIPRLLADAGYFEALAVTTDDLSRGERYRANEARATAKAQATDLAAYLRNLDMVLRWRRLDETSLARVVQLINKTNQFNLTTRRLSIEEVRAIIADPCRFGIQFRLTDRFGDNGIVAVVTGHLEEQGAAVIDDWVMSCRVFGREVERATLNVLIAEVVRLGAVSLVGQYRPTEKNGMVRDHYQKLGFETQRGTYVLPLPTITNGNLPMRIAEEA